MFQPWAFAFVFLCVVPVQVTFVAKMSLEVLPQMTCHIVTVLVNLETGLNQIL